MNGDEPSKIKVLRTLCTASQSLESQANFANLLIGQRDIGLPGLLLSAEQHQKCRLVTASSAEKILPFEKFPILIVDWKISDTLSLETGRGFAATRGPGLQLRWEYSPRWQFALGGRYEKPHFRLDDSGPAPGGVGQDKAVPLYAQAEYRISEDIRFILIGGAETGAKLRLENDAGQGISSSDLSTAPFLGATFRQGFSCVSG